MISVATLTLDDAETLQAISSITTTPAWSKAAFESSLNDHAVIGWKAVKGEHILGFILTRVIFDEAEILNFAIHPLHQRQGYGQLLITHFINQCQRYKITSIFLEVNENNVTAISLYKKFNFIKIDIRDKYYQISQNHWDNALIMKKNDLIEMIDKSSEV